MQVSSVFDRSGFSYYQYLVCSICFLVTFLDGFDLTVIGVALPKLAEHLASEPGELGLALSAGQFGPLVGAIGLGMLADRWGRKWMLFISAVSFGFFTFLTVYVSTPEELAACRFFAGIGLGGAVPNALTLGSEYAPKRFRATIVASMYAGMPAGAMTGGLLAAYLIPHFGWQALFYFGGFAPLFIGAVVAIWLPESLEFLVRRGRAGDTDRVQKIVSKVQPDLADIDNVAFIVEDSPKSDGAIKRLFTEGRCVTTLLLWLICSAALYMLWILITWAPTLLRNSGATVQQYSLAYACISLGAFISSIYIGRLLDKRNPFKVLQVGFILGAISMVAFGAGASSSFLVIAILSVICGMCINGSQAGTLAVATLSYPSDIRATGIGWTYAVAKVGAMLAPLTGGYMLSQNWSVSQLCNVNALTGIVIAGALVLLQMRVASSDAKTELPYQSGGVVRTDIVE
jgi:AAHS family 4-hydroxybenzoate transporter-like MFS transporter